MTTKEKLQEKEQVEMLQEETLEQITNHWIGWENHDNEQILEADKGIWSCLDKLEELTGYVWDVDIVYGEFYSYWYNTL